MVHCNIIDEPHIGFTGFREFTVMSKQLTMSAAVSVLAMAVFALLGTDLPGVGTIYTGQTLKFTRPVHFGEEITTSVTVKELNAKRNRAIFECLAVNPQGKPVIISEATMMPPKAS